MFIIRYPTSSVDISRLIIYYTDFHDVDEVIKSNPVQGGFWSHGIWTGLYDRSLDSSGLGDTTVASRLIYLS